MTQHNLWAPWRLSYIQALDQTDKAGECFLCEASIADDEPHVMAQRLLLLRDQRGCLLLNRYPYTNGHLLAAPHAHVSDLSDLTPDQRAGLMELAELGTRLLKIAVNPHGFNIGMNLGRCAGAGVPGHAHLHIVPRWNGDVNFLDVVGHVRVIPQALEHSYQTLRQALTQLDDTTASD